MDLIGGGWTRNLYVQQPIAQRPCGVQSALTRLSHSLDFGWDSSIAQLEGNIVIVGQPHAVLHGTEEF